MTKTTYHIPLQPNGIYHILSHANGQERIFRTDENRRYFLYKYQQHISPIADTYAWCLMPNHFHFLIQIRSEDKIAGHFKYIKRNDAEPGAAITDFLMERFANWLNGYTKAINKMYNRKGSLFMDYLRRVQVTSDQQIAATLFYIHKNPVHHNCCKRIEDWHWSSFPAYVNRNYGILSPQFVQRFFGTVKAFEIFHTQPVHLKEATMLE